MARPLCPVGQETAGRTFPVGEERDVGKNRTLTLGAVEEPGAQVIHRVELAQREAAILRTVDPLNDAQLGVLRHTYVMLQRQRCMRVTPVFIGLVGRERRVGDHRVDLYDGYRRIDFGGADLLRSGAHDVTADRRGSVEQRGSVRDRAHKRAERKRSCFGSVVHVGHATDLEGDCTRCDRIVAENNQLKRGRKHRDLLGQRAADAIPAPAIPPSRSTTTRHGLSPLGLPSSILTGCVGEPEVVFRTRTGVFVSGLAHSEAANGMTRSQTMNGSAMNFEHDGTIEWLRQEKSGPKSLEAGNTGRGAMQAFERVYLGIITVAALFVAYLGFLAPARMDESFTWVALPPLHARFVASLYLFGTVYLGACTLARRRTVNGPVYGGIVMFTGLLLTVTLLNLKAFDFDLAPVWVWTVSYIVYPALAVLIGWRVWRRGGFAVAEDLSDSPISLSGRIALQASAALFGLVGLMLLVERERMVRVWPWKVSNGLAQFYAAPALAIAFCAWRYSRRTRWTSLRAFAPALLALGVATIASSVRHRSVLGATDLSLLTWYAVFGFVTAFGLVATIAAWRPSRSVPPEDVGLATG